MESYTSFAEVYDEFMDQTPYEQWCKNVQMIFEQYRVPEHADVVELGCGTGKMTRLLAECGYGMTALDSSAEMLEIAVNQREDNTLYVLQDMVKLELPGQIDAVISICDCMNYILEKEDLQEVFGRVRRYLKPQGVFLFDMNSRYKYEELLDDHTFAEDREECSFIWDNFYDWDERINEYQLSLFIQNETGMYDKFEEVHFQKAYDQEEVEKMLKNAGFQKIKVLDADTMEEPAKQTERLYYIAQ